MHSVQSCFFMYLLFVVVRLFSQLDHHIGSFCLKHIWYLEEKKSTYSLKKWWVFTETKRTICCDDIKSLWQGHYIRTNSFPLRSGLWAKFCKLVVCNLEGICLQGQCCRWWLGHQHLVVMACVIRSYFWNGKIMLFELLRLKYAGINNEYFR